MLCSARLCLCASLRRRRLPHATTALACATAVVAAAAQQRPLRCIASHAQTASSSGNRDDNSNHNAAHNDTASFASRRRRRSRAWLCGAMCGAAVFPLTAGAAVWYERRRLADAQRQQQQQADATASSSASEGATAAAVPPRPQLGGPFCVQESRTGNAITDRELFAQHWTLLYFGFSKCAEVCPTTLRFLADVLRRCDAAYAHDGDAAVAQAQASLQVAFLSIDHIRDSPATMEAFVSSFGDARIRGLCGTRAQVEGAARVWRVYYSSVDETDEERQAREAAGVAAPTVLDDTYQFDHSAAIYLVGPDGKMRDFMFKEMGVDNAVDRIGVHFANVYGFNDDSDVAAADGSDTAST